MTALIETKGLSVRFATGPVWNRRSFTALHPFDLTIEAGQILGVVGESGSGKSTLGNALIGRQAPTEGEILFKGEPLSALGRRKRAGRFAAVLQHPKWSLNPMLRIRDSVLEPLRITGAAPDAVAGRAKAGAALEQVSLPGNYQDRYPHELSGGQRQRVSIARALITQPEFVLFDEAVSALDVSVQAQILNLIKGLQVSHGFSAIFISHDLAATRYVANRIAVLHAGRLVEDAEASVFYGLASHPYSRGLQFASGLTPDGSHELAIGKPGVPPTGCALAPRCPRAMDRCNQSVPMLSGTPNHRRACFDVIDETQSVPAAPLA